MEKGGIEGSIMERKQIMEGAKEDRKERDGGEHIGGKGDVNLENSMFIPL